MSDLTTHSLSHLAALIRRRTVSPVEVIEAYLHRIDQINPMLNAIVTLAPDAMEKACEAEAALMRGDETGALHGVPVTIKDTIETKGLRTTSGSRVRATYVPREDATAVARLRNAGAIILGKTNVSEMAAAYDTENPVFGHANNPYDLTRTSGGSSGGEAAAIAACLSPGGLGSDLAGSIRIPAHFCGIVGLKPSSERSPCDGHIPSTTSATSKGSAIGPMARSVEDLDLLYHVLAGMESHVSALPTPIGGSNPLEMSGCNVAWYAFDGVSPVTEETRSAVEAAAHALEIAGLQVREEKPPEIEHGHELWNLLFARAASAQLCNEYAGREEEAGALVRYLMDSSRSAATAPLDQFSLALDKRNKLRAILLEWMKDTQLIIAPVGATPAYKHGARKVEVGGEVINIFRAFSYSQTYNVFDLPVACVPAGVSPEGLPIGVQIVGRPFEEESVLAAAGLIEKALGGWREPSLAPSTERQNPL